MVLLAGAGLGAVAAVAAVAVARSGDNAQTTHAGTTWAASLATLAAAVSLFGTIPLARPRVGVLLLGAGWASLAPIVTGWPSGPPSLRAAATIAAAFLLPLLAHIALAAPSGRLEGWIARVVPAAAYAWTALTAVVLALVRDPFYDLGCWADCDGNAFLVRSWPALADPILAARPWAQLALGAAVTALAIRQLRSPGVAVRLSGLAAAAVGAAAILHALALLRIPPEDPVDPTYRRIFLATCLAAVLAALAAAAPRLETALRRRAVSRVVAALDEAPAPDALERTLGEALGDAALRVVFHLPELDRYVDAVGVACAIPAPTVARAVTPLARRGEIVAWIDHSAAVGAGVEPALTSAVRLAIDNARLRAGLLAQLRDLRGSRSQIVRDGDDERRRLERDLHDGVQQQVLALAAELRAGAGIARRVGDRAAAVLDAGLDQTAAVLEEVRTLAHGVYPAILTDGGLAPAVASLADIAALPVRIVRAPAGRFPVQVETAAYHVVAESIDNAVAHSDATFVAVDIGEDDGAVVVEVNDDGGGGAFVSEAGGLVELGDRIGALDGTVSVASGAQSGTTVRAVIPCGS
jgi:signal transduction histidine kinase